MEAIGLCGGTFDPFHRGHLQPILAIIDEMRWNRVIFIPAFQQPFKIGQESVSGSHRFAMAALATQDDDRLLVSALELERVEISYTVDTLERCRAMYPQARLDWIIGDDNVALLPKWRALERILELANFVVLQRQEKVELPVELAGRRESTATRRSSGAIVVARNQTLPISATEIRQRVRRSEPIDHLVAEPVARYIRKHRLYLTEDHGQA